jgi:uncharacterized membrane protein YcaP (DUF421 family)
MSSPGGTIGTAKRLLMGNDPFQFLGEIVLRTLLVYLALMVAVRLLGKRMSGQITNLELAVMITLGAIVAVPMEISDRGILPAAVLLASVLSLQAALSYFGTRSLRLEQTVVGKGTVLVKDGTLLVDELRKTGLSQQQLFSALRAAQVRQLGEITRVYLEGHGAFSIIRRERPEPGLSILPTDDSELRGRMPVTQCFVCAYCGNTLRGMPRPCTNCRRQTREPAVASEANE